MNKPVAWALITKHSVAVVPDGSINHPSSRGYIPLYTHPVKELTDDEITDIGYKFGEMGLNIQMIRAILRKAQEK